MTVDIIKLAQMIVKRERVKMPVLKGWQLNELLWWIENLGTDLL